MITAFGLVMQAVEMVVLVFWMNLLKRPLIIVKFFTTAPHVAGREEFTANKVQYRIFFIAQFLLFGVIAICP